MNLRIGAFGRQESASAVWIASFASGCFAFDPYAQFSDGNLAVFSHAAAAALSLLLFALLVRGVRRRGGYDLSLRIASAWGSVPIAAALSTFLLLSAVVPLRQFALTMTREVFSDAKRETVCLYLLPCLTLLAACGAETLVRTSRILLPALMLSILAALAIGAKEYRVFRLFPIPTGKPLKLLSETLTALPRTFAPLLALLCIGEGTQNAHALKSAGVIGAAGGAAAVIGMLFGLSLSFSYGMLKGMSSPFCRMLVEARTENPTMRIDRAALFLWMAAAILAAALYLYAAGVLFCRACRVGDVRPVACAMCAIAIALVLLLSGSAGERVLTHWHRWGWAVVPIAVFAIALPGKEKRRCAACA